MVNTETTTQRGCITNKGVYFYFQLMVPDYWSGRNFSGSFWANAFFNFLAGSFTLFIALLVIIFEVLAILSILNLVMDYRVKWFRASLFQRYSYVFIMATIIVWFWSLRAWKDMSGLSYGFYGMFIIWLGWIGLKFHYRFFKSRLYRRRQINNLLIDR